MYKKRAYSLYKFCDKPTTDNRSDTREYAILAVLVVCVLPIAGFVALQIYKLFFIPPNFLLFLFELFRYSSATQYA